MGNYEIIERLCSVARAQADIIERQALILAQADIADELEAELSKTRETAAAELEKIEMEVG